MNKKKMNIIWVTLFSLLMVTCGGENRKQDGKTTNMEETSQVKITPQQLNQVDADGRTLLHQAAVKNDIKKARLLITKGAPLEKEDKYGYTPLHYAAKQGHREIVQLLVSSGANLNPANRLGYTPLHWAARMGHGDIVELLIASGADPEAKDIEGKTPKDFAIKGDSRETLKPFYPLHLAVEKGDIEAVKALLEKNPELLNAGDHNGRTPLHLAEWYDRKEISQLLAARGANAETRDKLGLSPGYYSRKKREKRIGINLLGPSKLKQVDNCVYDILNHYHHINVGLVHNGEIVLTKSYGKNCLNNEDVYASVSKPVTAVIVLQLLEEGKIKSLDDDIREYSVIYKNSLPLRYKKTPITFMHLLTHRSGVQHLSGLWKGKKLNLSFEPGTRFRYSTSGYGILGQLLQEITGQSFDSLVKQYIGSPVGGASFWAEKVFRAPGARIHSIIHDMALFSIGVMNAHYVSEGAQYDLMFKHYSGAIGMAWICTHLDTPDLTVFHAGSNGIPRAFLRIKPRKKLAAALLGKNKSKNGALEFENLSIQLMEILENIHQKELRTE